MNGPVAKSHLAAALLPTLIVLSFALSPAPVEAQFGTVFPGFVQLPQDDFTWIWGDYGEREMGRRGDISARGSEASFRCDLTAELRPASRLSRTDIRQLEQGLNTSLAFIQEAARTMTVLDNSFELDWARLECKRPTGDDDAEKAQERLDKAVERAIRARERRRAQESD